MKRECPGPAGAPSTTLIAAPNPTTALVPYTGVATWWRRRRASRRLAPLACGCADPWVHHCTGPSTAGYTEAAHHLLTQGLLPSPNTPALRLMWRAGGAARADARVIAERWELAS